MAEAAPPGPPAPPVKARWFDGTSSLARPVLVRLQPGRSGPSLELSAAAPADFGTTTHQLRSFAHKEVGWPETWSRGKAPQTLTADLGDHGSLEIDDAAAWQAALAAAGASTSLSEQMLTRWPVFLGVLAMATAGLVAFYTWGTPWAAKQVTTHVPLAWEQDLAERALHDLDESLLKPSKLPPQRQAELRQRFDALAEQMQPQNSPLSKRFSGYSPRLTLAFRAGLGANAFALPGGTIVMTDGLVRAAAAQGLPDDALIGVLAHEIGHVLHRHTTRMVVEQGVLNVGLGLALGDVSSLVSISSSLLTGLAYRRNHEQEADCFAVALMRQAQLPTTPMADLLLGIDGERSSSDVSKENGTLAKPRAGTASSAGTEVASPSADTLARLLSSHPQTAERARRLKLGLTEGC